MSHLPHHPNPDTLPFAVRCLALGSHNILWLDADDWVSDDTLTQSLHETEKKLASSIKHPLRRQEFLRARWLARFACHALPDYALDRSPEGAPFWPPGWCGSITHKNGTVAVVAALISETRSLGIDLEECGRMSSGVEERVATLRDHEVLSRDQVRTLLDPRDGQALMFSGKESLFKCCFPLHGKHFWFEDGWLEDLNLQSNTLVMAVKQDFAPHPDPLRETPVLVPGWFTFLTTRKGSRLALTLVTAEGVAS